MKHCFWISSKGMPLYLCEPIRPKPPGPSSTPVLDVWQAIEPMDFPNYQSGTWGPEIADALIAQDGRSWIMPTFLRCEEDTAICRVLSEAKP